MSSAFYPQGMKSYGNHVPQGGYKTWKGSGPFSNPVGIAPGHIRPLTNKDPGNVFPTGFGLPRPIKHYRKGRSIKHGEPILTTSTDDINTDGTADRTVTQAELDQINYNVHRYVQSSKGQSLGGGSGGSGMIQTMMDAPGEFLIKENSRSTTDLGLTDECVNCEGVGVISSWYPIANLTEKPEPVTTTPTFCCNEEYKARRRALPTSTNLKKNYYQTSNMYLYNRCQTFKQREFNFITERQLDEEGDVKPDIKSDPAAKPGSAGAMGNLYVANCNPNGIVTRSAEQVMILDFAKYILHDKSAEYTTFVQTAFTNIETIAEFVLYLKATLPEPQYLAAVAYMDVILFNPQLNPGGIGVSTGTMRGCKRVYYKPNNPSFAKEGAVSSATRTFKLNVTTIEKNAASIKNQSKTGLNSGFTNSLVRDNLPNTAYIYKMKTPKCTPSTFTGRFQNPRMCSVNMNDV